MNLLRYSFCLLGLVVIACSTPKKELAQRKQLFDNDWRFHLGDSLDFSSSNYEDSNWRSLDLPHDWSIEHEPDSLNPSKGDGGFYPAGIGWYRKSFEVPSSWKNKKVLIYFEGVYMNAEVFINGKKLGIQPYGYTSFDFDLTPYLNLGEENVLAVKVDNSHQRNSRWYSGSGIYRHVWLEVTEPVHIAHWGTAVTTPVANKEEATVHVRTLIKNETEEAKTLTLSASISGRGADGAATEKLKIAANDQKEILQELKVANPLLWSPESPELYRVKIDVKEHNNELDSITIPFGIRTINFSAENGFELNGKKTILNGGNVHHDNGSLGAAAYDRAEIRKVKLLKKAGFNAVRTAHNPPSEAFLYACDSLGLFVIDEAFDGWREKKNDYDYTTIFDKWWKHDVQSMVLRDRNHPSIILWSIGNEIIERKKPEAVETAQKLADAVKEIDTTRGVTSAMTTWDADWEIFDPLMAVHDVAGYNYQLHRAESDHERVPSRIILQTESYPKNAFSNCKMVQEHDYIIGDFVWTALDYLGESGIGRYYYPGEPEGEHWMGNLFPWHGAYCGDVDLTGWRKPISHYRSMLYNGEEKIYMAVQEPNPAEGEIKLTMWAVWPTWESWTWPGQEGKDLNVEVYSKYPKVRLYLNDSLLGEKKTTIEEEFKASFKVPYQAGQLKAVGVKDDEEMKATTLVTAGEPEAIELKADRDKIKANNQDLSYINVEITDDKGNVNPNADNELHFEVEGPGEIIAVDNANLKDTTSYKSKTRNAWHGRAMVVVKSTQEPGAIKLKVKSEALKENSITLISR